MRIYAGIGSRETPPEVCETMTRIAVHLNTRSWLLRSGHAPGADEAFEKGSAFPYSEIFLPWQNFRGAMGQEYVVPTFTPEIQKIAKDHHPRWDLCNVHVRKLHMRNVCQVLGQDCQTKAAMVICWTPEGKGSGGTGQAIRIARAYDIPVFDIALDRAKHELCEFLDQWELT